MKALFDCRLCVQRASDFVNGDLSATSRLVTRLHLVLCRDCRVHVNQLETTVKLLHELEPDPTLADETKRALIEALRARK